MSQSNDGNERKTGDFELKIKNPELFAKITNDNLLFVFLESGYNGHTDQEDDLWIIPRSNLEEFKNVSIKEY